MGEIADQLIDDFAFNGPTEDWQKPKRRRGTIGGIWRRIAETVPAGGIGRDGIVSALVNGATSGKQRNRARYRADGALPLMVKAGLLERKAGLYILTERCAEQLKEPED